jgi:signal transduction histidine kinase
MRTEWERPSPSSSPSTPTPRNGDDSTSMLEMAFVPDVLEPILTASKAVAMDQGVGFQILPDELGSDLPGVRICPKALQEAIANLLDNAIKYVILGDSNAPTVSLTWRPNTSSNDESGVTIWIHDNGPGIPIHERDAIFQRGYRATNARERVPGSGIGLDISKSLITSMGGRLELVTTAGGGTTMQITLFRDPNNV